MTSKTQWILSTFYVSLATITISKAANILVFAPLPFKSHFGGFQPLFQELAHRGHNVTVVSSFPLKKPIENYTDIVVGLDKSFAEGLNPMVSYNFFTVVPLLWNLSTMLALAIFPKTEVKNFIQSDNSKFDLVFVYTFGQQCCVTLGHKYNAPVISLNALKLAQSNTKWIGESFIYSYIPDARMESIDKMSFINRFKNTIIGFLQLFPEDYMNLSYQKKILNTNFKYKGWESRPSLEDMLNNVSLTLVNGHYSVGLTRPYLPGTVEVGGLHIKEPKQLKGKLLEFVESAEFGVIYISFGTIVNPAMLPEKYILTFINVFKKLKQKVMWRWIAERPSNLSDNVMISEWFPQADLLGHPNVKLFITHGGLHSFEEASYNAKPLIGLPFFADQHMNMRIVEEKGFGKMIDIYSINEESLLSTINEVLENPKYNENSIRQSLLYRDRDMKPIDRAVYWVEYVLRHKGAMHLKSISVELNPFQYFLIDITMILFICTFILVFLITKLIKCIFKSNCKIKSKTM